MLNEGDYVIKTGLVESIEDEFDGGRIKVRLRSDGNKSIADLPYTQPWLPRTIQSVPKVGEAVWVLCSQIRNDQSNRFYIGPIISQPQQFYKDSYMDQSLEPGSGRATTMLESRGSHLPKLPSLSATAKDIYPGAFPPSDSVALVGRKGEDIYLRDDEIIMRAGGRIKDQTGTNDGYVQVNKSTPAVQFLQYKPNGFMGVNSVGGMCAGKIGLFSNNFVDEHIKIYANEDYNGKYVEPQFMTEDDLRVAFEELHQIPYGDKLVSFLKKFLESYFSHTHPWAQKPLTIGPGSVHEELHGYNLDSILTNDIYIS